MTEYNPARKKTTNVKETFTMPTGQLETFCRIPRATPSMPKTAATSSRQLVPCAASHAQNAATSARERCEQLVAGLLHAIRCRFDRRHCPARRATNLDVRHRSNRGDVVVRPGLQN